MEKLKDQLTTALATMANPWVWDLSSRELISEHILQQTAPIVGACRPMAKFITYAMKSRDVWVSKHPATPVLSRRTLFKIVPTSRSLRLPVYESLYQRNIRKTIEQITGLGRNTNVRHKDP